jgi:hypothetical protein
MSSCKKDSVQNNVVIPSTNTIKVPLGFNWENSRSINISINITDSRFQNMLHVIAIYDSQPSNGGNLITKGSASTSTAFKSKLYLSNQIKELYIVKTSPDNSTSIQMIQVGSADISLAIAE